MFFSRSVIFSAVENIPPLSNSWKNCEVIEVTADAISNPMGPNLAAIPPNTPKAPPEIDPEFRNDPAPSNLFTNLSWKSSNLFIALLCVFYRKLII